MEIKINEMKPNEVVRKVRETTGLSQKEFGKTINRGRDSINNIEHGINRVFFDTVLDIANTHDFEIVICKKQKVS